MDNAFLQKAIRTLTGQNMSEAYIEYHLRRAELTPTPEPSPKQAKPDPDGGMSIKEALAIAHRLKDQLAGKGLQPEKLATYQAVEALTTICKHLEQRLPARK